MQEKKILDKNISFDNYATFQRCNIISNGKIFRFIFTCGAKYDVPIDYFLSWNKEPHYIYLHGRWVEWERSKHECQTEKNVIFLRYRRLKLKTAVQIYLSNKTAYIVPWDTVLMACEKKYEHFGGLTEESKRITNKFFKSGRTCN